MQRNDNNDRNPENSDRMRIAMRREQTGRGAADKTPKSPVQVSPRALSRAALRLLFAAVFAALFAGGCGPSLYAVTPPPPTRTAEMITWQPLFKKRRHKVRLSAGAALAFNCVYGGPCAKAEATSEHEDIVKVMPAHLNRFEPNYMGYTNSPTTTFVLVGVRPGETHVRIRTKKTSTRFKVIVSE